MVRASCPKEWDELSSQVAEDLESVSPPEALSMLMGLSNSIAQKRREIRDDASVYAETFGGTTATDNASGDEGE